MSQPPFDLDEAFAPPSEPPAPAAIDTLRDDEPTQT
jgi:hypothetical protein